MKGDLEAAVVVLQQALGRAGLQPSPLLGNALLVESVFMLARAGVTQEALDSVYQQIRDGAYAEEVKPALYGADGRLIG